MIDYTQYNLVNEVFELNSKNDSLSNIDPFIYKDEVGNFEMPDTTKYPTKYFLKEIAWEIKCDKSKIITLKTYGQPEFNLEMTIENLYYVLVEIKKEGIWSAEYAKMIIEKLNSGQNYLDLYNLVLEKKMKFIVNSIIWSEESYKKYVLEYELGDILNTSDNLKYLIIKIGCESGLISIFDRHLQNYSRYIVYQGTGMLKNLYGSCGISFYYRQKELCYVMQIQS